MLENSVAVYYFFVNIIKFVVIVLRRDNFIENLIIIFRFNSIFIYLAILRSPF